MISSLQSRERCSVLDMFCIKLDTRQLIWIGWELVDWPLCWYDWGKLACLEIDSDEPLTGSLQGIYEAKREWNCS